MNGQRVHRTEKHYRKSGSKQISLKNIVTVILTLAIVIYFSTTLGSSFVNAESRSHAETAQRKYFKSIEICEGDTLWAIASEYKGDHYDSIYAYIDEVMEMNGLDSDQIHAGQYLTVPYYDSL